MYFLHILIINYAYLFIIFLIMLSNEETAIKEKFQAYHQIREDKTKLKIAYYPFRGKGQLLRLLCQYIGVPYQNFFFTPWTWESYKTSTKNLIPITLPFIKDQQFIVSDIFPTCIYIIEKYGHSELLGKSIHQRAKIQSHILNAQVFANLMLKFLGFGRLQQAQFQPRLKQFYQEHMKKKILDIIEECNQSSGWYMEYLTLIDFQIYLLGDFLKRQLPQQFDKYQTIKKIHKNVSELQPIKQYLNSNRYVTDSSPIKFFKEFKMYLEIIRKSKMTSIQSNKS